MENNFEKHIRDAMDNPPEFPFEERLWKDMESQLDKEDDDKKPLFGFMGKLPLFLLALAATSLAGFFYFKQSKAMKRIVEVERQLANQQQINTSESIEKRVTIVYDTIYNKIVIDQVQSASQSQYANSRVNQNVNARNAYFFASPRTQAFFSLENPSDLLGFEPISIADGFGAKQGTNFLKEKGISAEEQALATAEAFNTYLSTLSTLDYSFLDVEQHVNLPAIKIKEIKRKKRMRVYLNELKPTYFALSGMTGTFASLNLGGNGFNLRGMAQAELGFGKRFSLVAGAEYFSNDFNKKIDLTDEEPLRGFPEIEPNNSEDIIQQIQGDFNYLQVPFGVKYTVFPRRYFYPYISAGLVAGRTTRSRLEYQFLSSNLESYAISQGNLLPPTFELSAFWSTLGFEIQMNKHWSLLLEGSSQFDLTKGQYKYENLSILKLGTGLRYEF